ncbi:pentatricopeptide repeat-containing protein At2g34400 [Selaginella moellendorffii]|uniref:pentatricopeptide repeat-containing protein At2g34400 n=1 Tax=Selaginella moellendorffii TaxID=88036 RepID=UPI000D1C214D|nr:pentatricopeptide repeat-containing protein At2g34400 [Selaginella moellendorffii]|eukprot:XP_024543374.1 pentatricopeptide repeat-containing protein At2g34400 [Selaginella moellendorffii]
MRASSGAALKESEVSRYARLLQECCSRRNVSEGRRLHDDLRRSGYGDSSYLRRCVVQMYAKCGCLADAKAAFDEIADKNDFVWNLMISGYARSGKNREALELFHKMDIPPNGFIFASALAACAGLGDLEQGREIHKRVLESRSIASDVVVQNSLVTMYARCGSCDYPEQALELYHRMKRERLEPNGFVFASLLTACASLGNLQLGSSIHQRITSLGLQRDIVMENALINMYSKCGCMDEALEVFSGLATRDVFTWTSMIAGYAQLGFGSEAFAFYDRMRRDCVSPTSATFVALLSACSTLEQDAAKGLRELVSHGNEPCTVRRPR